MNAYDGKPSNRWTEMWYFNKVSFAELANNMGAFGIRVTNPDDIKAVSYTHLTLPTNREV